MTKRISYRISDARAQLLAVRAWMGTFFPKAQGIDADEAQDLVERAGSSVMVLTGIYCDNEPARCIGVMCWRPSEACDRCIHDGAKSEPDMSDIRALLLKYGDYACIPYPPLQSISFQSRHEMESEAYLTAPPARGKHALVEPRAWRMSF